MQYTDEMIQFLKNYAYGHSWREITETFNKKFGTDRTERQIGNVLKRRGFKTGHTGCFEKGNIPVNKGQKMSPEVYEKCKATMFKKGNVPVRTRPLYSERLSKDGYIEVKTPERKRWVLKQRVVWEKANGKIPANHIIIFKDGNRLNCELDNLMMISRRENAILNHQKLRHNIPELTETEVSIAKLIALTKEVEKKGKGKNKSNE